MTSNVDFAMLSVTSGSEPVESENPIQVKAGESISLDISFWNTGDIVDVLEVTVEGLEVSWHRLSVLSASLFPKDEKPGQSVLTITVPDSTSSAAKVYPFSVKVNSRKDPANVIKVDATIEVLPFYAYTSDLKERERKGDTYQYSLDVTNQSNTDLEFTLADFTESRAISLKLSRNRVKVAPGESESVDLSVSPLTRPRGKGTKYYTLNLQVTPPSYANLKPLNHQTGCEVHPKPWPIKTLAIILGSALILASVLTPVISNLLTDRSHETSFSLRPGQEAVVNGLDEVFGETPVQVELSINWVSVEVPLEYQLIAPDNRLISPVSFSPSDETVEFRVNEKIVDDETRPWVLKMKNLGSVGQAEGTLTLKRTNIE